LTCKQINLGNGATAIVCSRGARRERCRCGSGLPVSRLCDFELRGRKAGQTCSAKLCDRCSSRAPATELDYCQAHARLLEHRAEGWRTVGEMAEAWGTSPRAVEQAILVVGVLHSKAHASGEGAARRWSPAAQGLVHREVREANRDEGG